MKYFFAFLILLFWLITTIILTISILGLFVVVIESHRWFEIPEKILIVFEDKNYKK
jgi:hypothetical protein